MIEAIKTLKPPVLLTELDDFSVLECIRNEWSPETFVIGRFYYDRSGQEAMLDEPDPEAVGRRLAEQVLTHNFAFARRRGHNGRPFVDAWMSLNESIRGPNSFPQLRSQWRGEDEDVLKYLCVEHGLFRDECIQEKVLSPAKIEKLLSKEARERMNADMVDKPPGGFTIAPVADQRAEVAAPGSAQVEFQPLDTNEGVIEWS